MEMVTDSGIDAEITGIRNNRAGGIRNRRCYNI